MKPSSINLLGLISKERRPLFSGLILLGTVVQVSNAFQRVHGGFSLFLHNWTTITELRSIWKRLHEFEQNLIKYETKEEKI